MNFKKTIIAISILSGVAYASNFLVVVDKEQNDFKVGDFTKTVEYGEWNEISESNCEFDVVSDDFYYGEDFSKVETCDVTESRTVKTTTTYYDGNIIVEETTEKQVIAKSKDPVIDTGTHLESTCKNALAFDSSLASGYYKINPNSQVMDVYCDMTTSGGGWTVISKESGGGINEALYTNAPVNDGNPQASSYRMSRANMTLIQSLSTQMRLDCRGSDHLEAASTNLFNGDGGTNDCNNNSNVLYTSASLKGYLHKNKVICTWNTGVGSGVGRGCAGAWHIDETAQQAYGCGLTNYPWAGTPIVISSTDTFAIAGGVKDSTTDCHKSGAQRYIMLK